MNRSRYRKTTPIVSGRTLLIAAGLLALALLAISGSGHVIQAAMQITTTPTTPPTAPPPTPTQAPSDTPAPTPTLSAPTLVPPTPLPEQAAPPSASEPVTESALASVQADRTLRIGTYYNASPFTWLDDHGTVTGYEPEIMRAIGIELNVEPQFIQVTRHNAVEMLTSGQVDVLIGQQIHSRDREDLLDYTHPYYLDEQRMVVQQDSMYTELAQLAGQPISVEIGSRAERALHDWSARTGITLDIRTYFSEGDALDALANGEVQGMVGELSSLRRAGRQKMRLIDEPILREPYAIAVRRWDANMRNLLDRSLQRLKASGRLDQIFADWFPNESMDFNELVPVYDNLYGDERTLDDFNTDIPYPPTPVLDRIEAGQPIRVAGIIQNEDAPAQIRIMNALNQAMIEDMALRWGAKLEYVPNSVLNAVDLVANGQADIAVGVSPRWDGADRAGYSQPYIQHGNRLLVPANSQIEGFADMLGTGWYIGYFADDAGDAEDIKTMADYFGVGSNVQTYGIQRESDAIYTMTVENNIKAIFGDSLRLLALMRETDNSGVKMLDTWYGDVLPVTFAVPRNDADFRALVDFTLQDMELDGTYQRLWSEYFDLGDPLVITIWPSTNPDP